MSEPSPAAVTALSPLVDFVLRHGRIKTNLCTRQAGEAGYKLLPRVVPDYNFIYITRGQVMWVVEGRDLLLKPGSLAVVPPAVPHHGSSVTRHFTLGSIHVEFTLPGGQDVFELLVPPRLQEVAPGSWLDRYLRGAMEEFDREERAMAPLFLPGWARLVTLELLRDNARRGLLRDRGSDPVVAAVLEELNRRLDQEVALPDLAAWAGFSPQHLNRVFRRVLGVTPLQYLTRLRVQHAAALLDDGRLTVRAIARRVGFDDPYYFSRIFKQHQGQSPDHYRESLREKAGAV